MKKAQKISSKRRTSHVNRVRISELQLLQKEAKSFQRQKVVKEPAQKVHRKAQSSVVTKSKKKEYLERCLDTFKKSKKDFEALAKLAKKLLIPFDISISLQKRIRSFAMHSLAGDVMVGAVIWSHNYKYDDEEYAIDSDIKDDLFSLAMTFDYLSESGDTSVQDRILEVCEKITTTTQKKSSYIF